MLQLLSQILAVCNDEMVLFKLLVLKHLLPALLFHNHGLVLQGALVLPPQLLLLMAQGSAGTGSGP